jgi:hypothetical protein
VRVLPASPEVLVVILRQPDDRVLAGIFRIGGNRVGILVVANERPPDLLSLVDPIRIVERVAEVVEDAGESR